MDTHLESELFTASISADDVADRHYAVSTRFPGAAFTFVFDGVGGAIVSAERSYPDGQAVRISDIAVDPELEELAYDAHLSAIEANFPAMSAEYRGMAVH